MPDIRTVYGTLNVPDWDDDLIIRTLRTYGEWAFAEQMLISPMLREGDALWDAGAYLGTFGLGVAQLAQRPLRQMVFVEPSRVLGPYLLDNLTRNAPCPVRIAPFAIGQAKGLLQPRGDGQGGNAGAIAYEPTDRAKGSIPCRPLRDLRGEYGDYDVLKLDIEGMENEAIRGDIDYILQHRPVIWAECNEHVSSIALLEALVWLKYEPVYVAFPFFRQNNTNQSSERIFPMAYEAALLAAPPDRLAAFTGTVPGEDIIIRPVKTSYDLRRALWSTPRWAMEEWVGMSKAELIGQLGHQSQHGELGKFLNDGPPSGS